MKKMLIRNFEIQNIQRRDATDDGKEEAIDLLKYLVKGARIISLTGEQGCRKNHNAYGND